MKGNQKVTDGFVLTFDDGLLDHYDFVFPELMRYIEVMATGSKINPTIIS